ncbi:hypothetical protein D3C85_1918040 [compost metagenome]
MQARTFKCAKVQIATFRSFGLQHRKEFNVLLGTGGQHHFTDRTAVGWGEQLGAGLR